MADPLATSADRRRAREALSAGKRAYALRLRQHGATQAQIAAALALSPTRVGQLLAKVEHLAAQPRWHGQFPARALNFLIVRDLADKPEAEAAASVAKLTRRKLMGEPNLGKAAIGALAAWLAGHGLTLGDEIQTAETEKGAPARERQAGTKTPTFGGRSARVSIRSLGDGRRANSDLNKSENARLRRRGQPQQEIGHGRTTV